MSEIITGRLERWWYDGADHNLSGCIYEDAKDRFEEGDRIYTSELCIPPSAALQLKLGDIVPTCNSIYLLGDRAW